MRNAILLLAVVSCLFFANGCASIMCGSEKTISIRSHPSSKFTVKNARGGVIAQDTAPTTVTLKRGRGWFQAGDYTVTFEKEGYQKTTVPINQGLETGWYGLGNIVFGGLIGYVIVDPLTGAMWNIKDVNISLEPKTSKQSQNKSIQDLINKIKSLDLETPSPEETKKESEQEKSEKQQPENAETPSENK